ncbi:hypothetical protein BDW22DRAFT_1209890 [Trametopsis cervina]|nr:hypothetical protein BDW22DRAFT_1209890 [Trametopsis cervina]
MLRSLVNGVREAMYHIEARLSLIPTPPKTSCCHSTRSGTHTRKSRQGRFSSSWLDKSLHRLHHSLQYKAWPSDIILGPQLPAIYSLSSSLSSSKSIMLFRSFVALSLLSLAAASPAHTLEPPQEDCHCSTVIITSTIFGTPTTMTSLVPTTAVPTSVVPTIVTSLPIPTTSVAGSGVTSGLPSPTTIVTTVTITETEGHPHSHPTHTPPPGHGQPSQSGTAGAPSTSESCDGITQTEYTTVTVPATSAPKETQAPTGASSSPASSPSAPADSGNGMCTTGPVQCCNTVAPANTEHGEHLLSLGGLLDAVGTLLDGLVGGGCSSLLGVLDGSKCGGTPVCCESSSNSLISVGCVVVTL